MFVVAGQIAFWFLTILVLLGSFVKNVVALRRVLPWQPPSSLTDHSGTALSKDCLFFGNPASDEPLLYSAEVTILQPHSLLRTLLRTCLGAVYGFAWGFFGVWLSSIAPGVLQYFVLAICTATFALDSARNWSSSCITYVCADRFGFVNTDLSGSGKYCRPVRMREESYELSSIDGANPRESELVLNLDDGMSSRVVTVRRPSGLTNQHWQRWIAAVRDAFEELRWSESLYHLASNAPRVRDLPLQCVAFTAVRFDVLSVLTHRPNDGSDFVRCPDGRLARLPGGRLGFMEDGLVFENLTPLYVALNRIDALSPGIHLAQQEDDESPDMTEVNRVVERWRSDHVQYFPVATIESVHEDPDFFTIRMRDGKELEFQRAQVVGCPTLCRLMRSAIWPFGIEEELRVQMVRDVTRLQATGVTFELTDAIFGRYLPEYRARLWDVAYRLGVSTWESGERADTLTRHAFQDSQRLLRKRNGAPDFFLDVFLGWERLRSDPAGSESVTDVTALQPSEVQVEEANERPRSADESSSEGRSDDQVSAEL